jgi:hypothetical protein
MSTVRIAFLVVILTAGFATEAIALSYKDIAGRWCGQTTNYVFARNALTVTFHSGGRTRRFKVTSYEYLGDTIKMHWQDDKGEKLFTDFSDFSRDGRTMAQRKNEAGPRRPFRRCR